MITFKINDKGASISRKDEAEFRKYVMTTDEIVNTIISGSTSTINNDEHHIDVNTKMLRSFFNNPNRNSLKTTLSIFTDFKYGYGIMNGKLIKVIMWLDDTDKLNFAMYQSLASQDKGSVFSGHIVKIYVQDGDVFIKNQMEAALYLADINGSNDTEEDLNKQIETLNEELNKIEYKRSAQKKRVADLQKEYNDAVIKMSDINTDYEKVRSSIYRLKRKIKIE